MARMPTNQPEPASREPTPPERASDEAATPGRKWIVFLAAAATLIGSGYLLATHWRPDN